MPGPHSVNPKGANPSPFDLEPLLPCPTPRITWSCAAPVFEYAIRSALCGGLEVTAWPKMGTEWAFLVPPEGQHGCGSFHTGRLASAGAGADRWIVRRRGRRILGTVPEWSSGDVEVLDALRRGRERADLARRLSDDLLLTSARLRDVAFRVWSHHAQTAGAEWVLDGPVSPEDLAARLVACGPLPLWPAVPAETATPRPLTKAATFVETLRAAFAEIRILLDEIARRAVESGGLATSAEIENRDWNTLPALVKTLDDQPV